MGKVIKQECLLLIVIRGWNLAARTILTLNTTITYIILTLIFQVKRSPQELYRHHLSPEDGGKVPESAHLRAELNKVDAMGLGKIEAQRISEALKNTPLPEKLTAGPYDYDRQRDYYPEPQGLIPTNDFYSSNAVNIDSYHDEFNSFPNFPYNPIFDTHKKPDNTKTSDKYEASRDSKDNFREIGDFEIGGNKADDIFDSENYGNLLDKPHLFTSDPYAQYLPHQNVNLQYNELDYYRPPSYRPIVTHDKPYTVEEYKPYKPYKPVGPILLDKRPHEVTEIKSLPVTVHETYTSFDCRRAPYPDRHYADPEAGCAVSIYIQRVCP